MLRRVMLAALLSLAPALALAPAANAAAPAKVFCPASHECVWIYYNNAQHTTETGSLVVNCAGQEIRSGTATAYDTYGQETCINLR